LELQQGGLVSQARRVQLQSTGVVGVDVTQQTSVHRIAGGQLVQGYGLHQHVELSQVRTEAEATDSSRLEQQAQHRLQLMLHLDVDGLEADGCDPRGLRGCVMRVGHYAISTRWLLLLMMMMIDFRSISDGC